MSLLFFHEKRAEKINEFTKSLLLFDANKASFDIMYDIAFDIKTTYPDTYIYQYEYSLYISIPNDMTREQFDLWLTYLEETYLDEEYTLLKNHVSNSDGDILAEYVHQITNKKVILNFHKPHCKYIKTGKFVAEYKTECTWGE